MMSVLEYAEDVGKTVEEILAYCKKLEIKVTTEEDMLSDLDITLLDNEIQDNEDYITEESDYDDDDEL